MNKKSRETVVAQPSAALAALIAEAKRENITLVRYNPATQEAWLIKPDGTVKPYKMESNTDWARINALTEDEIEALAAEDDSFPVDWLDHAVVIKKPTVTVANGKH